MAKWVSFENLKHTMQRIEGRYAKQEQVKTLNCTFTAAGWQQSGSKWVQTAVCTGMRAAQDYTEPQVYITSAEQANAAEIVLCGVLEPLEGQIRATVSTKPALNVQIFMRRG